MILNSKKSRQILICFFGLIILMGVTIGAINSKARAVTTLDLPETIRVFRTTTGVIDVVDFKEYVKNVLPNEWCPSWNIEALKAGAMADKTYAWYRILNPEYPGQGYDVRDDTWDQVYMPGSATQSTDKAIDETWNWIMTKDGSIFESQYDSGTPNSPDPLYPGRLSQWGSQYWAEGGKDWQWILRNYYALIEITSMEITPIPDIKVNGSDGPITLSQSDTLSITVALDNNGITDNADWWLAADTPFGLYFFTIEGWTTDLVPECQAPLFYLDSFEVLNISVSGLPAGTYTFYFALDTNMDGNITPDTLYYDSVKVIVH